LGGSGRRGCEWAQCMGWLYPRAVAFPPGTLQLSGLQAELPTRPPRTVPGTAWGSAESPGKVASGPFPSSQLSFLLFQDLSQIHPLSPLSWPLLRGQDVPMLNGLTP
jgi:hypothetical protein